MAQPGDILLGKYRLDRPLGKGGMGEIFQATHLKIGKRVAIKVLEGDHCSDQDAVERFQQEAVAASQIGHHNIIDIYDLEVTEEGQYFLVMELLEGLPLNDLIRKEAPFPIPLALTILRQLLSALDSAHSKGIIHRDIKPENIFLITVGAFRHFVKLLDFGIARVSDHRLTVTGAIMGTPAYLSPEQLKDSHGVDARSDIYALGVLTYEMLTGRLPYEATDIEEIFRLILMSAPYPLPSEMNPLLDRELESLVLRAMAHSREDRPPSAAVLMGEVQAYMDGHRITTATIPHREPGSLSLLGERLSLPTVVRGEPRQGRSLLLLVAALALVAVGVGTALAIWRQEPSPEVIAALAPDASMGRDIPLVKDGPGQDGGSTMLVFETSPASASIRCGEREVREGRLALAPDESQGNLRCRIEATGYQPRTVTVELKGGDITKRVELVRARPRPPATIQTKAPPAKPPEAPQDKAGKAGKVARPIDKTVF